MASSSIRKRPSGAWRARYRDDAGREHARHFDRKIDAQQWLDEVTAARLTGMYVDPRAGRKTFKAYAEEWAAVQPWRPKTRYRVDSALKTHLNPGFGDRPLGSITTTQVQAFVTGLSATLAPSTVQGHYALLRSILKAAVRDRVIAVSPCVGITVPPTARKSMTVPTITEVRAISEALPERFALVPFIGVGLGLRPGEILGLKVACIDFLRRTVTVEEQLDDAGRLVELKTPASRRTVPLPDALAPMITEHLRVIGPRTTGLLFTTPSGLPVKRNTFGKTWAGAAKAAGHPGMRLHDMRHGYASALIDAGESVKVVQDRLGHTSATMTLEVYSHLFPASEDRTRKAVDAFLTAPADSVRTAEASSQVSGGSPDYLEKT